MDYLILQKFLTALAIGAIIGTVKEKEKAVKRNFGGFRTFILVSLTGAFSYFLTDLTDISWLFPVIFLGIVVMTGLSYVFMAQTGRIGIKTELAIFLTYILGYIAMTEYATLAIIMSALIVFVIESDRFVHKFIANTNMEEWLATLRFGAIALIVYPILPDHFIDPYGIINPSRIWFLVVLISGIGFVGYFLIKTLGSKKGILLNGILGGLVSSTATTLSLSGQSLKYPTLSSPLALSTTIASVIMFFRALTILAFLSPGILIETAGYIFVLAVVMTVAGLVICRDVIKDYNKSDTSKIEIAHESPFDFFPALRLAIIFTLIQIASNLTIEYIGNKGIYLISLVSGLVDVDPIIFSLTGILKDGKVEDMVIIIAVIIATTMNTGLKGLVAYINGSKEYGKKILQIFGITFASGLLLTGILIFGTSQSLV